jgi:hypothetical protein
VERVQSGRLNRSLGHSGSLVACMVLMRSSSLSPTAYGRLFILSDLILCPVIISCAWTWKTCFLFAFQYCLAGCNSRLVCRRKVSCPNGTCVCTASCVASSYLFRRLGRWVWVRVWSIVVGGRRRRIAVLRGKSIVGEISFKETIDRCRGLQEGSQQVYIRPHSMTPEYNKRSRGKLTLSDTSG